MTAIQQLQKEEIDRYSRHLILPEVGLEGQLRLKNARVLCVGVGGLGSPLIMYLAAAGVGHIGMVDADVVDFSNLQRQILHYTSDVGRSKLDSAIDKLRAINPFVEVTPYPCMLNAENAMDILRGYDVVVDGTDNFQTRYLVNDACVLLGIPNVHASISRFEGQASIFYAKEGPCYRCLYPDPPPAGEVQNCAEGGVLGVLAGMLGVIQCAETLKWILGRGQPLIGRLMMVDALDMKTYEVRIDKDPNCPICGQRPSIHELIDYDQFCGLTTDRVEAREDEASSSISPGELHAALHDDPTRITLIDVREPEETEVSVLNHAIKVPLRDLSAYMSGLDPQREIVVYCLSEARSTSAVLTLSRAGFAKARFLRGGMIAWMNEVEPTLKIF